MCQYLSVSLITQYAQVLSQLKFARRHGESYSVLQSLSDINTCESIFCIELSVTQLHGEIQYYRLYLTKQWSVNVCIITLVPFIFQVSAGSSVCWYCSVCPSGCVSVQTVWEAAATGMNSPTRTKLHKLSTAICIGTLLSKSTN